MSALARPLETRPAERGPQRVPRRTASRAEIRALLAQSQTREGSTVERIEMSESGIPVREADLLWWGEETSPAAVDDPQYPGD